MTDLRPTPHAHHLRVQRTARYYTLGGESPGVRAVWIVLHGHGQLAGEFIRYFADLSGDETLIVAPEALNRYYMVPTSSAPARDRPVGATWMTREDRESEISDYVAYLDALHDDVVAPLAENGARVGVIGFSQGCATAARWLTLGAARVSRLVLWGGLLPPDTDLSRGAGTFHGAALTLVIGDRDHYVNAETFAEEEARLTNAGIPFDVIRFEGGHAIKRTVLEQLRL